MSKEREQFNGIMELIEEAYKQGCQDHIENEGSWFTEFRYRAKLREILSESEISGETNVTKVREFLPA